MKDLYSMRQKLESINLRVQRISLLFKGAFLFDTNRSAKKSDRMKKDVVLMLHEISEIEDLSLKNAILLNCMTNLFFTQVQPLSKKQASHPITGKSNGIKESLVPLTPANPSTRRPMSYQRRSK